MASGFEVPDHVRPIRDAVLAFMVERVEPAEPVLQAGGVEAAGVLLQLQEEAKAEGLWALGHPVELGGAGMAFLDYVYVNEVQGRSEHGQLALGTFTLQDSLMLDAHASEAQRERWLTPLVAAEVWPSFAMTEPDVASSDPTNLQTTAARDGDDWVLNGRKWCISGADGAAFAIVVAKTDDDETKGHRNYSLIIVPTDTPGWRIVRHPQWLGSHAPGGHPEIALEDVRVPAGNLLGGEGEGFAIAQRRLAGGRLAHAMRWIGVAQRALDLSAKRLLERKAFGKELARHQGLQFMVADSAMDLYASRLMVLHTAWKVEHGMPHRQEVAMTKTFVSEAFGRIADRAVQMHGAAGIAMDLPIAGIYADARAARIYDGASEVHRMVMAREVLKLAAAGESTRQACGDVG